MPQDHPDGTVPMQLTGADKKLPTDFQDQYVGMYLQPEWAAKEADDKSFTIDELTIASHALESLSYEVSSGKTLYISYITAYGNASAQADADKPQMTRVMIANFTTGDYLAHLGGNGGIAMGFPISLTIPAGHIVKFYLSNRANHSMYMALTAGGYEI